MNSVNLAGKVTRTNILPKVAYLTLCVKTGRKYEYIDITSFSPSFIDKYVYENDYIGVNGEIHVNGAENKYKMEVIAGSITLLGKQTAPHSNQTDAEYEMPGATAARNCDDVEMFPQ